MRREDYRLLVSHFPMTQPSYLPPEDVVALIEMGMPREVARYLEKTPGMSKWGFGIANAFLIVLCLGLGLLPVIAIFGLPLARWLIAAGVYPRDVTLIDFQLLSAVGFMLAGFVWGLAPFSALILLHRGLAIRSAISGIQHSIKTPQNRWAVRMMLRGIFRRMPAEAPLEDYLVAYHWASIRMSCALALWLFLPTVALVCWEGLSASYSTPQGIRPGGMFTWKRDFVPWDQVHELSTGSYGSGRKESPRPVYQLHYAGGSRDLASWVVPAGGWNLPALVQIDDELRQRNVPWSVALYEYGIYRGEKRWDPIAFEKLRAQLTPDEQELFDRVYRYQP